jgi:iron(III) transport system permease protein
MRRWEIWTAFAVAVVGSAFAMDERTRSLAANTLFLAGTTCAISLPLGAVLGWLLTRTDMPGRKTALLLLGATLFVPLHLQAAAWQAGFGLQGWHHLISGSLPPLEGWPAVVWIHGVAALPWATLIVGAGLRLVEPELEEQALLDGSPRQVLFRVTLSAALPALAVAALWVTILTAGEIAVTDLFSVRTYAEEVYTLIAVGPLMEQGKPVYDTPLAMMPGILLSAWLVIAGLVVLARLAPNRRPLTLGGRYVFRLGIWRVPLAILVGLLLLVTFGVPLASLCYKAGVLVTQTDAGHVRSWSIWKCLEMVSSSPYRYRSEFGWSLAIGALAATGVVAVAIPMAWLARSGGFRALGVLLITAVSLATPGPVVGLAVIWLLNRPECPPLVYLYDQSILAPWLALSVRGFAPATLILWHTLASVPSELLDAGSVDGAGPMARLWRIAVPTRLTGVCLAWIVVFILAMGDLAASILVVPPGVNTLSIRIFLLLHYGVEDRVAGICLTQVAALAALAVAAIWIARRHCQKPPRRNSRYNDDI